MKICYSAPAKIILSGEHAVVYGKPALLTSIDLRLNVIIFLPTTSVSESRLSIGRKTVTQKDATMKIISNIVLRYLKENKITFKKQSYGFRISSQIPIGTNLGSSAALSVASVAGFLEFYTGKQFDKETVNQLAYEGEKQFHGNPSGADNSASCFGGLISYRRDAEGKHISSLGIRFPESISNHLFIINSGKPKEPTKEMVEKVKNLYDKDPKKINGLFDDIEKVTERMTGALLSGDPKGFQLCIEDNEKVLIKLGVVSNKAQILLSELKKFGVGKVTGAGGYREGSGNILFYADDPIRTSTYFKKNKIAYMPCELDLNGLKRL